MPIVFLTNFVIIKLMEGRIGSGRFGGHGEPMTGNILYELARTRRLQGEGKATSAVEAELLQGLTQELKRTSLGRQTQKPTDS